VPTLVHSGLGTLQLGRKRKAGPSWSAALLLVAAAGLLGLACPVSLFGVEAAAEPRSASGTELEGKDGTVHGPSGAGAGVAPESGTDREIELVQVEQKVPFVPTAPEHSTMLSNCPKPDMVVRTPSGSEIVGLVALVETEVVPGVEAEVGMRHKRHCGPGWGVSLERGHSAAAVGT
jgi:hypothetical protein